MLSAEDLILKTISTIVLLVIAITPIQGKANIKAKDIDKFSRRLAPEVWKTKTCDGYKTGNPETEVKGIVVTWMATMNVIERAIKENCNFIITHEPTFFNHWDQTEDFKDDPAYLKKKKLIDENNIVIYRLHDSWDLYPKYGIHDSWAEQLGLSKRVAKSGKSTVFEITPISFEEFIKIVKQKMNHPSLKALGDPNKKITKIGLGVGAWGGINNLKDFMKLGIDLFITGETSEWQTVRYAQDSGICMIVVGHTRSETAGMQNCANFFKKSYPKLKVIFIDAGDPYIYF